MPEPVPETTTGLPLTLKQAVRTVADALAAAGLDEPMAEARRLVSLASGHDAIDLVVRPDAGLDTAAAARIADWTARRAAREPLSRILGEREFYGRRFLLSPSTLDPRPDTETLIEAALQIAGELGWRERPIRILDLGTGTGCILLTLLAELPLAHGVGVDIAESAVATAACNAARFGITDRAALVTGDGPAVASGTFDLVVSNPPYIPRAEIATLDPAVRDYDPAAALDGGSDGLCYYRLWVPALGRILAEGGAMLFEVGAGQADEVATIMERTWAREAGSARRWRDLGGHERCVAIWPHCRADME